MRMHLVRHKIQSKMSLPDDTNRNSSGNYWPFQVNNWAIFQLEKRTLYTIPISCLQRSRGADLFIRDPVFLQSYTCYIYYLSFIGNIHFKPHLMKVIVFCICIKLIIWKVMESLDLTVNQKSKMTTGSL